MHRPETIRLGPHSDDGSYTELTLELNTSGSPDSNNIALVQSAAEGSEEYILVTVQKRAKLRPEHLIVETGYYWNRPGTVRRDGAVLKAQPGREGGRAFEVRTTAQEVNDPFVTTDDAVSFGGAGGTHRGVHGSRRRRWNRWQDCGSAPRRALEATGGLRRSARSLHGNADDSGMEPYVRSRKTTAPSRR